MRMASTPVPCPYRRRSGGTAIARHWSRGLLMKRLRVVFLIVSFLLAGKAKSYSQVFAEWADKTSEWVGSTLNNTRSNYFEGEVVPFVYRTENTLTNGASYTFKIIFDYYNSSQNAGGFFDIQPYKTSRLTVTNLIGGSNPLPDGDFSAFYSVNADITNVVPVIITASSGSKTKEVTVTFTYTGLSGGSADIYWGLSISKRNTLGPGTVGASHYPGGSLSTNLDVNGTGSLGFTGSGVIEGLVSGMKYSDLNKDGSKVSAEPGLANWVIYLDLNNNDQLDLGEPSTTTDANGNYALSVLPGTYVVREQMKAGWTQTQPVPGVQSGSYSATITAATPQSEQNVFGNFTCATPKPTITAGITTFCSGGSVVLSSSAAAGNQWYKNTVAINGETGQTYTATTSGSYTVTVTLLGCPNTSDATVVTVQDISDAPVVTALCAGATTVSGTSTEADGTSIEVFKGATSLGTTTVSSGAWSKSVSALSAGDVITAKATASDECTSTASASVVVRDNSQAPVVTALCAGATTVSGTSTEADGTSIEVFKGATSLGTTTVSSGAWSKSVSALSAGDVITAKATASDECTSTASASVVVRDNSQAPVVTALCAGATTVSGTSTEADGTSIEVFKGATSLGTTTVSSGAWSKSVSALSAGDVITAKATASDECTSTASASVVVRDNSQAPVVTALCAGATTVSGTSTEADGTSIEVFKGATSLGTTTVSSGAWSKSVSALSAGDVITAKATASDECTSTAFASVVVRDNSQAPVVTALCAGATTVSGTSTEADGTSIEVFKGATSLGTTTVSSGAWSKSVSALSAGDVITAKATASDECTSTASASVVVRDNSQAPVVTALCAGATTVSGTSTEADGTSIEVFKGATSLGTTTVSSGAWSKSVSALSAGDVITAKATASDECTSTASASVVVRDNSQAPVVTALCAGATTVSGTSTEADGTSIEVFKGATSLGTTTVSSGAWSKSVSALSAGDVITAKATASDECTSTASASVVVRDNSQAPVVTALCAGATTVSGTSTEADGTSIEVFKGATSLGTTTVSSGAWSKSVSALSAGDVITAKATASDECTSTASASVVVAKNLMCASYSGDYFANTESTTTGGSTTVNLVFNISQGSGTCNSLVGLQTSDFTITFKDLNSISSASINNGTLSYDPNTGTVTAQATIVLGNTYSGDVTAVLNLTNGNFGFGTDCVEQPVITVSTRTNDFVTGGGYIIPTSSTFAGRPNSSGPNKVDGVKNNFGFNVKWNKTMKQLQGNWNTIIRRSESNGVHLYQVKAKPSTLVVRQIPGGYRADIVFSSVNFQDLTCSCWSDGGNKSSVNITVVDYGEPGAGVDRIYILIKDKSGNTWYESNKSTNLTFGSESSLPLLTQGNIQIHTGGVAGGITMRDNQSVQTSLSSVVEFNVTPNPTHSYFTVQLPNQINSAVNFKVMDILGRVVEAKQNLAAGQALRIGSGYKPGIYIIEVTQGNSVKQLKLVKQ